MTQNEQYKLIYELYTETIQNNEIDFEVRNGFDTYTVYNQFGPVFSFGYNKNLNKYGIKREKQLSIVHKIMEIPYEIKPMNFKKMYDLMKQEFLYQVVRDAANALYTF